MAKKKRKRIRKPGPPTPGKKKLRPGESEPRKPGGLDTPRGPATTPKPKPVGPATKKTTPKP